MSANRTSDRAFARTKLSALPDLVSIDCITLAPLRRDNCEAELWFDAPTFSFFSGDEKKIDFGPQLSNRSARIRYSGRPNFKFQDSDPTETLKATPGNS